MATRRREGMAELRRALAVVVALVLSAATLPVVLTIEAGPARASAPSPGTAQVWGDAYWGELGNGTSGSSSNPSPLPGPVPGLYDVTAVSSGGSYADKPGFDLALRSDGTVAAWGANGTGQLGLGTTTDQSTAVLVPNLSNVAAVSAGGAHGLALLSTGTVEAWGDNSDGQLGDGTTTTRLAPVAVQNLTGVTAISAGYGQSLAVRSDGTVWVWGDNLGNGSLTATSSTPVQVQGLSGITSVAAGDANFSFALRNDGTIWAWGDDSYGELGDNGAGSGAVPVQVSGITTATAVSAGGLFGLALLTDGTVEAWGDNTWGMLGQPAGFAMISRVPVSNPYLGGVVALSAGGGLEDEFALALRADGTLWSWGSGVFGHLGDGSWQHADQCWYTPGWQDCSWVPVQVALSAATAFSAGSYGQALAVGSPPVAPVGGSIYASEMFGGLSPSELQCLCAQYNATHFPVDTATGNFWHIFQDFSIPGRGAPLLLTHTYNSGLASVNGLLGYGWTDSYAMSLTIGTNTVTVNEEGGSQITFTQSGSTYSAPPRVIATLVQNQDGTYAFTRRARETFTFDATGRLTGEQDLNGYATTVSYPSGSSMVVTDPAGRTLTFALSGGHITSVTDSANPPRTVSFSYDGSGNLSDVTDVRNGDTHFTYDASHRLLTMTDPRQDGSLTNHYDASGRVDWQTDPMGRMTTFDYTTLPGATRITDPNGHVAIDDYDNGELLAETRGAGTPRGGTWTYAYDPDTAAVTSITDPKGNVISKTYDASGNLLTETDALHRKTTYTYNANNNVTSVKDPNGVTTTYTYDASHVNLVSKSTPLVGSDPSVSQATTYAYDDPAHPGDVTSMTDPDGKVWTYTYDADGDLASVTDPLGDKTTYGYDSVGRRTSMVSPNGNVSGGTPSAHTTTYSYDPAGNLLSQVDQLNHEQIHRTYDPNGNLQSARDADGNTTTYTYDPDNELTLVTRPDQTTLHYGYDGDGNQTSSTDGGGHTTSYGFNDPSQPNTETSVTDPDNRTTTFAYDGAGNLLTKQDPGGDCSTTPKAGCTTYGYDAANEQTSIRYSDGITPNVTSISYDADGQRTSMTDGTGTTTWTWDSLHRITGSTNGANATVGYGYDLADNLTKITYSGSTGSVTRAYDDAGRLHTVTDWAGNTTTYHYDADSNLTSQVYPNGTTATFTVDNADRVMGISDAPTSTPSSPFASFTYGRDAANQESSVSSTGVPTDNNSYGYTTLNQLHSVNAATYGYDAADDLTQLPGGPSLSYDAANQVTGFAYDARGNRVRSGPPIETPTASTYDQANRLTGLAPPLGLISGGASHTLFAKSDGTAWAWGLNQNGQLGNNSTTDSHVPIQVTSLSGVVAVAAGRGGAFSLALKSDGTVWAWGYNHNGQLGNNSTSTSKVPVQVSNLTGVVAIAAGGTHSLALKSDGTVWAWGNNQNGQLGNNSTTDAHVPVQVSNLTGVVAIAAGGTHSLALRSDGTVWAWGNNQKGQLGNNSTTDAHVPVQVSNLTGATAIAGGTSHSVALKSDGTVWAWGLNSSGQIGNNTTTDSHLPVQVSNLTGATAVAAGASHSLALKSDGTVWAWGLNSSGQLGNNSTTTSKVPVQANSLTGVSAIGAGDSHSLALKSDGTVWTWGNNQYGQLGNNSTTTSKVPVQVTSITGNKVAARATYTYDGDGQRASTTTGGTTTAFVWGVAGGIPLLLSAGSTKYVYGLGGLPLEQVGSSGTLYYHQDQIGSTRVLTDSTGAVVATYTYDAYGRLTASTGSVANPFRFAGQYSDPESGLIFLRARYYDPQTGQFLTRDPLLSLTKQPYEYGADNPLNQTDPLGLFSWGHFFAVAAVVAGGLALAATGVGLAADAGIGAGALADAGIEVGSVTSATSTASNLLSTASTLASGTSAGFNCYQSLDVNCAVDIGLTIAGGGSTYIGWTGALSPAAVFGNSFFGFGLDIAGLPTYGGGESDLLSLLCQ